MSRERVAIVVVAFGDEPLLPEVLEAATNVSGVEVELVVIDNGYTGSKAAELAALPRVTWIPAGSNTGFTGGCNRGAAETNAPYIVFLNSDAVAAPDSVAALVEGLHDPSVGLATAKVLLYDEPDVINTVGNPIHYSLISWSGGWGDPEYQHSSPNEPAGASGCFFGVRRDVWEDLGGFYEAMFAYGEDMDLSLRTWLAGLRVRYIPGASARHKYEFSRNPNKYYLIERNRWINILTLFEVPTLVRLTPGLLVVEAGIWVSAARSGWLPQKIAATRWLVSHRREIRERRWWVQSRRERSDSVLLERLSLTIDPANRSGETVPSFANRVFAGLGRIARVGPPSSSESPRPIADHQSNPSTGSRSQGPGAPPSNETTHQHRDDRSSGTMQLPIVDGPSWAEGRE